VTGQLESRLGLFRGAVGVVMLAACANQEMPLSSVVGPAHAPVAAAPAVFAVPNFVPRLARQTSETWSASVGTQASGTLRGVHAEGWHQRVFDPITGTVYADVVIPDATASVDPSFRVLCVSQREMRVDAPTDLGAYDLWTQRWLWRARAAAGDKLGLTTSVLATPDRCVYGYYNGKVEARSLANGAHLNSINIPFIAFHGGMVARWTNDRSIVVVTEQAKTEKGLSGIDTYVYDGRTFALRLSFWARCVEVGTGIGALVHDGIENEARRAQIARDLPELRSSCREPAPIIAQAERFFTQLPPIWIPVSESTVAFHGEGGLYLWDHGHERAPFRIAAASPLARYRDINNLSRPQELVVPPDGPPDPSSDRSPSAFSGASWVGAIRDDGRLARFSTGDGAPLPDVPLPGPLPVTAGDAQWQVIAGARDRLIAARHIGGRRTIFVGDTNGNWRASAARAQIFIWQSAEHLDAERAWLLGDPVYGVQRLDEITGKVTAAFNPTPGSWARNERPVLSPDRSQVVLVTSNSPGDDGAGIRFLDSRTLRVLRRLPYVERAVVETWGAEGLVLFDHRGLVATATWQTMDPVTGALRPLARGDLRFAWQQACRGTTHIDRDYDGGALVSGPRGTPEHRITIVAGEGAIEYPDGHVSCTGAACATHKCVVGPRDARPASDPACARLFRRGGG